MQCRAESERSLLQEKTEQLFQTNLDLDKYKKQSEEYKKHSERLEREKLEKVVLICKGGARSVDQLCATRARYLPRKK